VDLGRIARWGRHRLIHAEVTGIDRDAQTIQLKDRPDLPYDILSINIGSAPTIIESCAAAFSDGTSITPVKPIDGFSARWEKIVSRITDAHEKTRFVVVGAGAGGIELTLAMEHRLQTELKKVGKDGKKLLEFKILNRGADIMPQHNQEVREIFRRILNERGIQVEMNCEAIDVSGSTVSCTNKKKFQFDECIWCTQASAQAWIKDTGLELDQGGFIAVHPTMRSINTANVFACGDVAAVLEHPRPKAGQRSYLISPSLRLTPTLTLTSMRGVFAVRQGPPVAENVRRALLHQDLVPFTPQSLFLGIIGTGEAHGAT